MRFLIQTFLERHIHKEDNVIYKFAQRELSREVLDSINMECESFEFRNEDIRNKYVLILEELENRY